MNNKTIYVLCTIFVAVLGLVLLAQLSGKRTTDGLSYVLPSLRDARPGDEIDSVVIDRASDGGREKLVFDRVAGGWELEDPRIHVDAFILDDLVSHLRSAHAEESADVGTNLKDLGLDPPKLVVLLTRKGDGRQFSVNVGNQSGGSAKNAMVYVTSSEVSQPMAVRREQIEDVFKTLKDFIPPELLAASALNTSFVQFDRPGNQSVLALEKKDNGWFYVKPAGWGEAEPDPQTPEPEGPPVPGRTITGVKDLMEAVGGIQMRPQTDVVTFKATEADLDLYGLTSDHYATLRIEIQRTAVRTSGSMPLKKPISEALLIGKKAERKPEDGPIDHYFVRRQGENVVARVAGKPIEAILTALTRPEVFRDRDLVHLNGRKPDAIDVQTAAATVQLRHFGLAPTWRVYGLSTPGEADAKAVNDLISAVTARRPIKEFPPDKPDADYGLDKPAAVVKLWVNGIAPNDVRSEKTDAPPKVEGEPLLELTFGKTEKDLVYARSRTGRDARLVALPATLLEKVAVPPVTFLTRQLPSFMLDQVVKLEVTRGTETIAIEPQPSGWKLIAPATPAGKADGHAVVEILAELSRMHPERLVAEKPSDLAAFGLKPPAVTATVTFGKANRKMTYLFGKETPEKKGIYAKQEDRNLVFVVNPDVLKPLQGDLTDPTVFSVDPAAVKEVKISGWKKLGKGVLVLRCVKTAKGWEAAEAPAKPFPLDVDVLEGFIGEMAGLKTKRIVSRTGPLPRQQLGEAERLLTIELKVDGMDKPLTLTLGALDAGSKDYFATASTRKSDVFLFPRQSFADGPDYFKKAK